MSYAGVYWNSNSGTTFGHRVDHRRHLEHGDVQRNPARFRSVRTDRAVGNHAATARTSGSSRINNLWDQGPQGGVSALLFMQACKALPASLLSVGILPPANGNIWLAGNPGSSLMWDAYNHFMPPNGTSCAALNDPNVNPRRSGGPGLGHDRRGGWGTFMDAIPPSSNHPGGVNICFADGSVRFVKNKVTYQTWWALGTRNGQEALSSDAY